MTKNSKDLATKIVEKYAEYEKVEKGEGYIVKIPLLGYRFAAVKTKEEVVVDRDVNDNTPLKDGHKETLGRAVKTSKGDASTLAIDNLAKELDEGIIILADDWAEKNL